MECYRRAIIGDQTFEGRRENLAQANKLSRTYATLLEALNRHRGKGQQKVTVEHVHVHAGGRPLSALSPRSTELQAEIKDNLMHKHKPLPMHLSRRRRCRMAGAGCTAAPPPEPRKVSTMATTVTADSRTRRLRA